MFIKFFSAFCVLLMSVSVWSQNESSVNTDAVDEILVVGEQPGPGLWKVSSGEHVLWILGTYSPLPKKMTWRSRQVETILAQTEEFIEPPYSKANIGYFKAMTLLPSFIGIKKNPEGAKLQEVVSADIYTRWLVLKEKYLGSDKGVEKYRPIFAASILYDKAIEKNGLTWDGEIMDATKKIVKKNKIKTTSPVFTFDVENPKAMIKNFKKTPLDDGECFSKTIDRLEVDIDAMQIRANAWAMGDIDVIAKLTYPDQDAACFTAVMNSSAIGEQLNMQMLIEKAQEKWIETVVHALDNNQVTFAVLPISELLKKNGYLATLEKKGYTVEAPK